MLNQLSVERKNRMFASKCTAAAGFVDFSLSFSTSPPKKVLTGVLMSGINLEILRTAVRIRTTFVDGVGNTRQPLGTGFFVQTNPEQTFCLVTNLHLVDPRLKLGENTGYRLVKAEVQLRSKADHLQQTTVGYHELSKANDFFHMDSRDVAVFVDPVFGCSLDGFWIDSIGEDDLADHQFFIDYIRPLDQASFIGFPGRASSQWWDTKLDLAIARTVNIASLPDGHFTNESIPTGNVVLVSGLSFSGSSGSIVVSHEKTLAKHDMPDVNVRPKVIGIMSGHWWENDQAPEMFRHSGLSYFTRSSSIVSILNQVRKTSFENPG